MHVRLPQPGLVLARFDSSDELDPLHQPPLIAAMRAQLALGPTAVVMDCTAIHRVSPRVPNWWLEHTPRICALAVVSPSLLVRALTGAFAMAGRLRGWALVVEVFDEVEAAVAWAAGQRALAAAVVPAPWALPGCPDGRPGGQRDPDLAC